MRTGVDGIDDRIEATVQNLIGCGILEEARDHRHFAIGMDRPDPLGHGLRLLAADLAIHGVQLAVDVGFTDFVQIHQSQLADP